VNTLFTPTCSSARKSWCCLTVIPLASCLLSRFQLSTGNSLRICRTPVFTAYHVCSSAKCPDLIRRQYALPVPILGMTWKSQFLSQPKIFLHDIYLTHKIISFPKLLPAANKFLLHQMINNLYWVNWALCSFAVVLLVVCTSPLHQSTVRQLHWHRARFVKEKEAMFHINIWWAGILHSQKYIFFLIKSQRIFS